MLAVCGVNMVTIQACLQEHREMVVRESVAVVANLTLTSLHSDSLVVSERM